MTSRGVGSKKDARNEQKTRSIKMKKKLVKTLKVQNPIVLQKVKKQIKIAEKK